MRKFSLIVLLFAAVIATAGVKNATTLCIEDKSGGVLEFALTDRPKITFRAKYTIVQWANDVKLLQFANLAKAYFTADDDPLAVSDQAFSDESMSAQAGTITLRNFKPLTRVLVYTTNGTLVKKAQTDVAGFLVFSLQDLPRGIYVVKAGKTTFKAVR